MTLEIRWNAPARIFPARAAKSPAPGAKGVSFSQELNDTPPPQRLTILGGNNSVSSISHQSETAGRRPVTKKRVLIWSGEAPAKHKSWPGVLTQHGGKIHIWTGTREESHFHRHKMTTSLKMTSMRDTHRQQYSGRLTRGTWELKRDTLQSSTELHLWQGPSQILSPLAVMSHIKPE